MWKYWMAVAPHGQFRNVLRNGTKHMGKLTKCPIPGYE